MTSSEPCTTCGKRGGGGRLPRMDDTQYPCPACGHLANGRAEMKAARTAGKAIHQAQRLQGATYTAVEMNVLTEAALQLGRNEMREEIAALCEKKLTYTANRGRRLELQELAAELRSGRDIGKGDRT